MPPSYQPGVTNGGSTAGEGAVSARGHPAPGLPVGPPLLIGAGASPHLTLGARPHRDARAHPHTTAPPAKAHPNPANPLEASVGGGRVPLQTSTLICSVASAETGVPAASSAGARAPGSPARNVSGGSFELIPQFRLHPHLSLPEEGLQYCLMQQCDAKVSVQGRCLTPAMKSFHRLHLKGGLNPSSGSHLGFQIR